MVRTLKDVVVTGRKPEEVKEYALRWLANNQFSLLEYQSAGQDIFGGSLIAKTQYRPHAGAMVAVIKKWNGPIVFETSFKADPRGTVAHLECYLAGQGFAEKGTEYELSNATLQQYALPRKEGYKLLCSYELALVGLSTQSLPVPPPVCQACHSPLSFIGEHQRWHCSKCQKYY